MNADVQQAHARCTITPTPNCLHCTHLDTAPTSMNTSTMEINTIVKSSTFHGLRRYACLVHTKLLRWQGERNTLQHNEWFLSRKLSLHMSSRIQTRRPICAGWPRERKPRSTQRQLSRKSETAQNMPIYVETIT